MFRLASLQPLTAPRFWLALWWCAWGVVLVASLLPMPRMDLDVSHGDKWLHVIAHAVLAGYAWMLFRPGQDRRAAVVALVCLGLAIEGLQGLLPWRSADLLDLAANLLGTGLGCLLAGLCLEGMLRGIDRTVFGLGRAAG